LTQSIEQRREEKNKKMLYIISFCVDHGSKIEFGEGIVNLLIFLMNFIIGGMNLRGSRLLAFFNWSAEKKRRFV
jgi:hypothetical protein